MLPIYWTLSNYSPRSPTTRPAIHHRLLLRSKNLVFTPEHAFSLANSCALLAWIALLTSPGSARWSATVWKVTGRAVPLVFAVGYAALLLAAEPTGGDFNSLAGVQRLFSSPYALTAGWVHYLAFDLFVGTWIAQRARELRLPHWQVLPTLVLTFLFGPLGYAAFIGLRALRRPQSLRWTKPSTSEPTP